MKNTYNTLEATMYSFSTTKKMFTTAAMIASFSIAAQTPTQVDLVDAPAVTNTALETESVVTDTALSGTGVTNFDKKNTEVTSAEVESDEVSYSEKPSTKAMGTTASTHTCPEQFYQVKLPDNGKLCQVFAADLPASMIFFVPQLPEKVIAFYQQDTTTFSTSREVKDRVLLQSEDKNTTLIISTDGTGTQVDILVKSSNS